MKRAYFQTRFGRVAVIIALIWSPAPGAALSKHTQTIFVDRQANQTGPQRTAEVKITAGPTGVLIEWRTSFGLDHLGFNIYREDSGVRAQVNPELIAGSAMIAGQGMPLYRWFDPAGKLDSRYYLEDVEIKYRNTLIGPYLPVWNESIAKSPKATLMSQVAAQSAASQQTGGPTGTLDGSPPPQPLFQAQWDIAAQPGLKIGVNQNGWYRVTQPQMVAAGFSVSGGAANLRLFFDAHQKPKEMSRGIGTLGPPSCIAIYRTGLDT